MFGFAGKPQGRFNLKIFSFWRSLASFRVRIALNLKGIAPDEVIDVNLMQGKQREEAYRKVNPQMMLPALIDGDGPVLFQSMAIMEYLDETHPDPPLLPKDPRGRARVRGLAQIVACDSHPLLVPRVREYLEHELHLDEPTRLKFIHNWIALALRALESNLAASKETGRYCHGEAITMADICLVTQATGAGFYKYDMAAFPTVRRIVDTCMQHDAFARAHPLKQPGAPASV
jgi:maleylacetoacetate isomerase